jgi:amino acid adenylation domain-containing protein
MLSWHNTPKTELDLAGLQAQSLGGGADSAQFELSLELRESEDGIGGQLNYASALFDEATVRRQWHCLEAVLRGMVADDSQPVDRIDLLRDAHERAAIVEGFNESHVAGAEPVLVHALVEAQAVRRPDAQAIEYAGESLSYAELNAHANQLAHHLRALGVKPDDRVAICAERSLGLVVALLATLKAGGAYVPLDPVYPDERLAHMLDDSGAVVLLTQQRLDARLQAPERCVRVMLDAARPAWALASSHNPDPAAVGLTPAHLAYVIYTSGSTGTPKGVMVEHRNVAYFLQAMEACIHGLAPDCRRVAWNSSFGFDMAVKAWGQLAYGRSVFLLPEAARLDAEALLGFLETNRIEVMECTPSHLRLMQGAGLLQGRAPSLRKLLLGGEAIDAATWGALAAVDERLFFNMYGPTECSVDASCGIVDGRRPHIGQVMPGARIYLLDEAAQPVPVGVAGEIHIGGAGVARGYLDRPALTAERFLRDPFASDAEARMYRTGDLGRWREDGTLEYLGRNDSQIKLRGFRIELGEIEARLAQQAGVREAAVIAREDVPGDKRLVGYVVGTVDPVQLRAGLAAHLPDYMLPSAFVALDALPLTPNGKLDRKALPAPDGQGLALNRYEPPQGEVECAIAALWSELLGVERIGRHDNFFDLGGYSLMVFQVIEGLKHKGYEVALQDVLLAQQLDALAALIEKPRGGVAPAHAQWVTIRKGGSRRPLVFVHEPSGEVLSYERLARHIDPEVGLYGIRADRDAVNAESRNEDLAAGYMRLIREALPQGPYRLAGWSAGGVLAFEVARQLLAAGEQVEFLGLIDSWLRGEGDRGVSELGVQDKKLLLVAFAEYYGRKLEAVEIERILATEDVPTAIALARSEGWLKKDMSPAEFDARAGLWFNLRAAAHRYYAQPLEIDAHLFAAQPGDAGDPSNGWSAVLGNRLQVHPIGGDHWSIMMNAAHAGRVGGAIASILARLDGAAPDPRGSAAPIASGAAVNIRSGSAQARKVFCLPGAGANATSFLEFASRSHGDAGFIGLEAPVLLGRDGEPPTLQAAAGRYVAAIRSLQPEGPYHLIGHSFGGWVALEAARQLIAVGATVAPVVLVDTEAPRAEGHGDRGYALREYLALIALQNDQRHGLDADALAALTSAEQARPIFEAMRRSRLLPANARLEDFVPVLEMFCRQCAIGYRPEGAFGGLALLLRAVTDERTDELVDLDAWRLHEPQLRSFDLTGSDHLSILKPPHVDRVIEIVGRHWYLGR